MTTVSGTLDSTMTFFPFGDCRNSQGEIATDRLFTGQRLDNTGLYYYGARYYDAGTGRFISADTLVPRIFNPQSLNRYSYCLNNPLKYIDPSGQRELEDIDEPNDGPPDPPVKPFTPPKKDEPNTPIADNAKETPSADKNTELTVLWGYGDEIPLFPLPFSYYHSVIVAEDEAGNFHKVETWGGSASIGGSIRTEIWQPDEAISIEDGKWTGSFSFRVPFIDEEPYAQIDTDKPYLEGGNDKHFYVGLGISVGVQVTRQAVTQISPNQIYSDMPRWVKNAYSRLGYNFNN